MIDELANAEIETMAAELEPSLILMGAPAGSGKVWATRLFAAASKVRASRMADGYKKEARELAEEIFRDIGNNMSSLEDVTGMIASALRGAEWDAEDHFFEIASDALEVEPYRALMGARLADLRERRERRQHQSVA